jgi:hypothetical protein
VATVFADVTVKEYFMKKTVYGFVAVLAAFVLGAGVLACDTSGGGGGGTPENEQQQVNGTVATPFAAPAGGTVSEPVAVGNKTGVVLTSGTEGAEIRYTLTGQEPSASSALYDGPVEIAGADGAVVTLKAVALKAGMTASAVLTAVYQIDAGKVADVTAVPASGAEVLLEDLITLASGTAEAEIRWTLDGSDPAGNQLSLTYATPIAIAENMHTNGVVTIRAYAKKDGMTDSGSLTAVYQVKQAAKPVASPVPGSEVNADDKVTLTSATEGAKIYYTTNGSVPTDQSDEYPTAGITVPSMTDSLTIKAIAVKDKMLASEVLEAAYEVVDDYVPKTPLDSITLKGPDGQPVGAARDIVVGTTFQLTAVTDPAGREDEVT